MYNKLVLLAVTMSALSSCACVAEPGDVGGPDSTEVKSSQQVADPNPADGTVEAGTSVKLSWGKGDKAQEKEGYLLFVGTKITEVADSFYRNHPNVKAYVVSLKGGAKV